MLVKFWFLSILVISNDVSANSEGTFFAVEMRIVYDAIYIQVRMTVTALLSCADQFLVSSMK